MHSSVAPPLPTVGFRVRSLSYVDSNDLLTLSTSQIRGSARILGKAARRAMRSQVVSDATKCGSGGGTHNTDADLVDRLSRMLSFSEHELKYDSSAPLISEALIREIVAKYTKSRGAAADGECTFFVEKNVSFHFISFHANPADNWTRSPEHL